MPMTAVTRGGTEYIPEFLMTIDAEKCIGCGRCYKVCGRDVMNLHGLTAVVGQVSVYSLNQRVGLEEQMRISSGITPL